LIDRQSGHQPLTSSKIKLIDRQSGHQPLTSSKIKLIDRQSGHQPLTSSKIKIQKHNNAEKNDFNFSMDNIEKII